jgi:[pyruvate, water dikinase]-phosphate phosphotransferase / [pyruvate, water dikinase] kinase
MQRQTTGILPLFFVQFTCELNMPTTQQTSDFTRTVFIVSDGTGITAETLAHSILSQFDLRIRKIRLPFIDTAEKVHNAVNTINEIYRSTNYHPIVFSTLAKTEFSNIIQQSSALHFDLIQTFVVPLEDELGMKAARAIGLSHKSADSAEYNSRMEAINFSLAHDDGQSHKNLANADVILVGVSRSGKTPTSLYLAMQYGIRTANYPLIPEDFERGHIPSALKPYKDKLFGLSITPDRLAAIRNERLPNSKYASIDNCRQEVHLAESMMQREGIRWLSSTTKSIEEIATTIMQDLQLEKRVG